MQSEIFLNEVSYAFIAKISKAICSRHVKLFIQQFSNNGFKRNDIYVLNTGILFIKLNAEMCLIDNDPLSNSKHKIFLFINGLCQMG